MTRNNLGLTTLEWLLIVAAVAGLAALAVVLVQNVVDETAEQIAGGSARLTAARVAAEGINTDNDADDSDKRSACNRLGITYSDVFREAPARAAFWSDSDTTDDMDGGLCTIVDALAKTAMTAATTNAACADTSKADSVIKKYDKETQLGDRTVIWKATGASPKCHLT